MYNLCHRCNNWVKVFIVFKNGSSKICGRQPLKQLKGCGQPKRDHTSSDFLKAVFLKFYLVHSCILCPNCNCNYNGLYVSYICKLVRYFLIILRIRSTVGKWIDWRMQYAKVKINAVRGRKYRGDVNLPHLGLELAQQLTTWQKFLCFDLTSCVDIQCFVILAPNSPAQ